MGAGYQNQSYDKTKTHNENNKNNTTDFRTAWCYNARNGAGELYGEDVFCGK